MAKKNPFIRNIKQPASKPLDHQSSGILDDHAVRKTANVTEGYFNSLSLPSMTAGSVLFVADNLQIAQDNSNFFWDDTNKRLGVGTNSPSQTVNVVGRSRFENDMGVVDGLHTIAEFFRLGEGGEGNAGFEAGYAANGSNVQYSYFLAPDKKDFSMITVNDLSDQVVSIHLKNSGNVGMGTTAPSSRLQVQGVGDVFKVTNDANNSIMVVQGVPGAVPGMVGIETDEPSTTLDVNGTITGTTFEGANVTTGQNPGHTHTLDDLDNPDGNKTFTMANKQLKFTYQAPATADGGFEIEATGGFSGDLVHIHQHTGNPGAVDLLHLEASDADVVPLRINGAGTYDIIAGAVSLGNITTSGTVDGIDIATDVAANTTHRGDNTQAHSDYLLNDATDVGVGLTLTGDNSSADTQYTAQVLYNTDAEPPAASGFPIGTLYVQYIA